MAYTSIHRGARISPTKVRPVIDLIRGKRVAEAEMLLKTSNRRAAVLIYKALFSAMKNAEHLEADPRRLWVVDARVDSGPTIKRFQEKDRGRAHAILKRTSHITVGVEER